MPTYDYQCRSCGTVTEVIHPMRESGPTACPKCGGDLRRVLFPAGIIFKGSGFYRTDSRKASSSESSGTDAAPASSGGSDAGAKGDAATTPTPSDGASGGKKTSSSPAGPESAS